MFKVSLLHLTACLNLFLQNFESIFILDILLRKVYLKGKLDFLYLLLDPGELLLRVLLIEIVWHACQNLLLNLHGLLFEDILRYELRIQLIFNFS